ncbi:hypothetical protein [Streptomyces mirabilis]
MKSEISTRHFTQLLSATPRGARLARLLAVQQLDEDLYAYLDELLGPVRPAAPAQAGGDREAVSARLR